ncbi:MAG: hypothetical protein DRG33_03830 [Deltaproteobacteria bacterium]|nr:MAG: hypothetical protein DRG33_03830 [Deltaproteobacteria bacterium]
MEPIKEILRKLAEAYSADALLIDVTWRIDCNHYFCWAKGNHKRFWDKLFERHPYAAQLQYVFQCAFPKDQEGGVLSPEFLHPADLLGFLTALVEGEERGKAVMKLLRFAPIGALMEVRYP